MPAMDGKHHDPRDKAYLAHEGTMLREILTNASLEVRWRFFIRYLKAWKRCVKMGQKPLRFRYFTNHFELEKESA
jgi:hypothetical protein